MRCYEHTFIARQDLSPQQAQALADTYTALVKDQGGEVTKSEYWGLRNLAYRLRKNRKGHYLHLNLKAPSAAIDELERQERLSDDVIRYLTVKVDELEEGPSVLMQVRSSREERTRRHDDDRPRRSFDDERPRRSFDDDRPKRGHDDDRPRRSQSEERPRRGQDEEGAKPSAEAAAKSQDQGRPRRGQDEEGAKPSAEAARESQDQERPRRGQDEEGAKPSAEAATESQDQD